MYSENWQTKNIDFKPLGLKDFDWRRKKDFECEGAHEACRRFMTSDELKHVGSGYKFVNENLSNRYFMGTGKLEGSIFFRCNLSESIMRKVVAPTADFSQSYMDGFNAEHSELRECIFFNARLVNASFRGADLRDCDFTGADLRYVDFEHADIRGAVFDGANVRGVQWSGCIHDRATRLTKCINMFRL
jgi:uncharacterized protein YjbI with pentapeptide repeats